MGRIRQDGERKRADTPPQAKLPADLRGVGAGSGGRRGPPGKSLLLPGGAEREAPAPGRGGGSSPGTPDPGPRPDTMEPVRGMGRSRAVAPSPPPAPTPPPPAPDPGEGHRRPLPAPQTPRGSRLGPAPLRLLGSHVAAAPGREGAKEEGRGGRSAPPESGTEAAGRGSGRRGRRGAQGGRGGGARRRRPPAGGAGGRTAAAPHHVGVLQASPLLLRLRSEWTAAAAAAPLTGSPGSRSCAVRGGPGAARGGSPGPRGGGGAGAGAGSPRGGSPGRGGPPGQGATHALRAPTSSRRARRAPRGGGRRTPTAASHALLPRWGVCRSRGRTSDGK